MFFYWTGIVVWCLITICLAILSIAAIWFRVLEPVTDWNRKRATKLYQVWEMFTLLKFIHFDTLFLKKKMKNGHFNHYCLDILIPEIKKKKRMQVVRNLYAKALRKARK